MSLLKASDQNLTVSSHFSQDYKIYVFSTWYANGKPFPKKLHAMLEKPEPESNKYPQPSTLNTWIINEFTTQAIFLDEQIAQELEKRLVEEKIEMLSRHAVIGKKMQEESWIWFDGKRDEDGLLDLGNARTAITLLVEGLKLERESVGVPQIAAKFSDMTDEQIVGMLKEYISDTPEIIDMIEPVEIIDV